MTRISILILVCFFNINCTAQSKLISGRISDADGQPLAGVSIYQLNSNNYSASDYNGGFHLFVEGNSKNPLTFACVGYFPLQIDIADTIQSPLLVRMEENPLDIDDTTHYPPTLYEVPIRKFGFITAFQVDFIYADFNAFEPVLGSYNTELMSNSNGIFNFELGGTYKKYYAGISWGFAYDGDYKHDSLDIEFNSLQYGLHFGYYLLDSKRFQIVPKVAVKWNRYRLINSDNDNRIPIEQYVSERDIDIRFNQTTGFVGLNTAYKLYKHGILPSNYWTIGVYGGYTFKLNADPWIYSRRNRLTTDKSISIKNYSLGFYFSFNLG